MSALHTLKDAITGPTPTKIVPAELLRPSFYGMLAIFYIGIFIYGLTADITGITSLLDTTSSHFTFLWSMVLSVAGLTAAVGVWLSRRFKREWIELFSTSILLGQLVSYAIAIAARAIFQDNIASLPSMWLPLIIAILPTWRLMMIGLEGNLLKKNRTANVAAHK